MGDISLHRYGRGEHEDIWFYGAQELVRTGAGKKDAKTFKKACGKRCTIFGGDFSLSPVLPEPLNKTRPPPAKYHVPARNQAC